ncbi:uncharacterized protein V2V93DRAFT_371622 [Kockiozyma suomiensis]|uniref:uncharacterized protein n=1 Tax=Kockiozyma suomiensis TaxID=1337062 RepID=UPI0033441A45
MITSRGLQSVYVILCISHLLMFLQTPLLTTHPYSLVIMIFYSNTLFCFFMFALQVQCQSSQATNNVLSQILETSSIPPDILSIFSHYFPSSLLSNPAAVQSELSQLTASNGVSIVKETSNSRLSTPTLTSSSSLLSSSVSSSPTSPLAIESSSNTALVPEASSFTSVRVTISITATDSASSQPVSSGSNSPSPTLSNNPSCASTTTTHFSSMALVLAISFAFILAYTQM